MDTVNLGKGYQLLRFSKLKVLAVLEWGSIGIALKNFTIDTNLFVLNMEDNGVLRTVVNYFKSNNTPFTWFITFKRSRHHVNWMGINKTQPN